MEKVLDLGTFLKKMDKKIILKDLNNRNYCIKDLHKFKKHISEFHGSGSSIHEENGFFFKHVKIYLKSVLKKHSNLF